MIALIFRVVRSRALAVICLAVLCVTLSLGLWPFHAPRNAVSWLKTGNGLRFGDSGTVASAESLADRPAGAECTIEAWFQPARSDDSSTLLAIWTPEHPDAFALRQSQTDLLVWNGARSYVPDVFVRNRPVFLTVASDADGTAVYRDAKLVARRRSRLPAGVCGGRIVLGTSPTGSDSWSGILRGVAVYQRRLQPAEVAGHYAAWIRNGRPEIEAGEQCLALYLFNERNGRTVRNRIAWRADLWIPERYGIENQKFLQPFWEEFGFSWSYVKAIGKNVVGLVPLGFVFYPWLWARMPARRAAVMATLVGMLTSVTIEVTQAWLPTRQSGTTDIFTNTFGAWVGVVLYRYVHRRWLGSWEIPRDWAANSDVLDETSQFLGTG